MADEPEPEVSTFTNLLESSFPTEDKSGLFEKGFLMGILNIVVGSRVYLLIQFFDTRAQMFGLFRGLC